MQIHECHRSAVENSQLAMTQQSRLPGEIEITGRTAAYTYRTPRKYLLKIPSGVEVRAILQGAQGGGGGAEYSGGGHQGEGGGHIVSGSPKLKPM